MQEISSSRADLERDERLSCRKSTRLELIPSSGCMKSSYIDTISTRIKQNAYPSAILDKFVFVNCVDSTALRNSWTHEQQLKSTIAIQCIPNCIQTKNIQKTVENAANKQTNTLECNSECTPIQNWNAITKTAASIQKP